MTRGILWIVSLLFSWSLFGASSVWKVSDGRQAIYLGGTIHLLRASDYPLPQEFERAFGKADYVVFETDLSAVNSAAFAAEMARTMMMPEGQTLCSTLKPSTCERLSNYLEREHYPITLFNRLRPWGVVLTLSQLQLEKYGIDENGVDAYFNAKAVETGKERKFLETPAEQLAIIAAIGKGEEDALLLQSLEEMEQIPRLMAQLVGDWRKGATERIDAELVETMKSESPAAYRTILLERNERWMPTLLAMFGEKRRGFVLVGTMHLCGPDGLLERFRRLGYRVEPFGE